MTQKVEVKVNVVDHPRQFRQLTSLFIMMKKIESIYSDKKSNYTLMATILVLDNDDIVVVVTGGYDHIGAIGLAVPLPSLADPNLTSATSSILTMLGHKEDVVARYVSEKLAAATNRNVVVVAGIHYDNLVQEDLETLREQWILLTKRIIEYLNKEQYCVGDLKF